MGKRADEKAKGRTEFLGSEALGILVNRFKAGTLGETIQDWKWILRYTRQYRLAVALYALFGVLSASLSLLSSVASKYTIDIITGYDTARLGVVLAVMILSFLLSLGLSSLISYVSVRISLRVNNDIQAEVFSAVLDADWLSLSNYPSGDILSRFNSDIGTVAGNAISWMPDIFISVYTFLATFLVIWHYDHIMAIIALASAPFLLISSRHLLGEMRLHNKKMKEVGSALMTYEAETFYNLDTIKSLNLMERYGRGLKIKQEVYRRASLDYNRFRIQTNVLLSLLGEAVRLAIFCYCLYLLWSGKIVYGTMTLFITQGTKLSSTFSKMAGLVPTFLNSAVSAHRIRELQQLPKEEKLAGNEALIREAEKGFSVLAEQLRYGYRQEKAVFMQVDFQAKPGEMIAVIGPSGEGKTTMIRLMLGLVHPQEGCIYLQNAEGEKMQMNAETRVFFSYVPQGNTILSGSIAENLRMGKENATDAELEEVLKAACAWDFVEGMPEGVYSSVGERGRGLSEGQAQRIAIARAILRDAPILLLDEATSALDVATERQVLKNILQRSPKKTCILTTHRPSVLMMCQRVYQVSDHTIRELSREASEQVVMDF